MKNHEIIKKSNETKIKIFRQLVTGNKLMTVAHQENGKKCINNTYFEQFTFKDLHKRTEESVSQYVRYGFLNSPEVSSEIRMWDFPMTRGHKSQKQYTLVKQCFH